MGGTLSRGFSLLGLHAAFPDKISKQSKDWFPSILGFSLKKEVQS
jgi:hypothetical protein